MEETLQFNNSDKEWIHAEKSPHAEQSIDVVEPTATQLLQYSVAQTPPIKYDNDVLDDEAEVIYEKTKSVQDEVKQIEKHLPESFQPLAKLQRKPLPAVDHQTSIQNVSLKPSEVSSLSASRPDYFTYNQSKLMRNLFNLSKLNVMYSFSAKQDKSRTQPKEVAKPVNIQPIKLIDDSMLPKRRNQFTLSRRQSKYSTKPINIDQVVERIFVSENDVSMEYKENLVPQQPEKKRMQPTDPMVTNKINVAKKKDSLVNETLVLKGSEVTHQESIKANPKQENHSASTTFVDTVGPTNAKRRKIVEEDEKEEKEKFDFIDSLTLKQFDTIVLDQQIISDSIFGAGVEADEENFQDNLNLTAMESEVSEMGSFCQLAETTYKVFEREVAVLDKFENFWQHIPADMSLNDGQDMTFMQSIDEKQIIDFFQTCNRKSHLIDCFANNCQLQLDFRQDLVDNYNEITEMRLAFDLQSDKVRISTISHWKLDPKNPTHKQCLAIVGQLLTLSFQDMKPQLLKKYHNTSNVEELVKEVGGLVQRAEWLAMDLRLSTLNYLCLEVTGGPNEYK